MNHVLLVHNSKLTNVAYEQAIVAKYPHLKEPAGFWKVKVIRLGKKYPSNKYTRLYYDTDSVTLSEITKYVTELPISVDVIGVSLLEGKKGFNVSIPHKVQRMKE